MTPPEQAQQANQLFLSRKMFDPWTLQSTDPNRIIDVYLPQSGKGIVYAGDGTAKAQYTAGQYVGGRIARQTPPAVAAAQSASAGSAYSQSLDLQTGVLTTQSGGSIDTVTSLVGGKPWPQFWSSADIAISGDPEAQQVTHANMFYLAGSAGGPHSIPPMGLSSSGYAGHIFWDAETWMFPALIVQHPKIAEGIIDYRFARLKQAMANAASHGFKGAEYPWESADTGKEEAPVEFAQERHITADVAFAAWQDYLWTGDKTRLSRVIWPIMKANADYWVSRASKGTDGRYHIKQVIGPDETSGVVDDDAWTNAIVARTLAEAAEAARAVGQSPNPTWAEVASHMAMLTDPKTGIPVEYSGANATLMAKQADSQLLIYPLDVPMSKSAQAATLDYCLNHTIQEGPAMTDSINALIAARLGRAQQSLDLFHSSYRPFMRGPWDAFSEKRTTDNVYFCTGMGGCLQTVLYGFAGLNVAQPGVSGLGVAVAKSGGVGLYADPHLPPGWTELTVQGVQFRGHVYDITADQSDKVTVVKRS